MFAAAGLIFPRGEALRLREKFLETRFLLGCILTISRVEFMAMRVGQGKERKRSRVSCTRW